MILNTDYNILTNNRTIINIYLDDILFTGPIIAKINNLKKQIKRIFREINLGPLNFYLGIEVIYNRLNNILRFD